MKPCPPFFPACLCLWWLQVFSDPRVCAGLGIPRSRCYLWCWEDAGKHVNATSAFRSPPSASFISGTALGRKQSPEPAEYFLLNTRNPEHCKNYTSQCGHCHGQHCLWEPGHFPPSLPPSFRSVSSLISQPSFPSNPVSIQGIVLVPFLVGDAQIMVLWPQASTGASGRSF